MVCAKVVQKGSGRQKKNHLTMRIRAKSIAWEINRAMIDALKLPIYKLCNIFSCSLPSAAFCESMQKKYTMQTENRRFKHFDKVVDEFFPVFVYFHISFFMPLFCACNICGISVFANILRHNYHVNLDMPFNAINIDAYQRFVGKCLSLLRTTGEGS